MINKIRLIGDIAVVTASANFHPLRQLKQLTVELDSLQFEGTVLFDLLAVNGLAENRFASMKFTNRKFNRSSFAIESDVNPSIKDEQNNIAKLDNTFLLGCVLSTEEVEKFTH